VKECKSSVAQRVKYDECTIPPTAWQLYCIVFCLSRVWKKTSGRHELDPLESASTYGHSRPLHDVVDDMCDVRVVKRADDVGEVSCDVFCSVWTPLERTDEVVVGGSTVQVFECAPEMKAA